jgi:hypothetical protein
MYPAVIADDHGSRAERRIFNKLRDETPHSWTALHSVGLASHSTKPWAEIDFVVIADQGVFCLEVKGGEIEHREGDWYTNGKQLKQSPFAQAGGGSSALYAYLAARVPIVRRSLVGHGVLFPDTRFDPNMPAVEHALIYDDQDLGQPFSTYLGRLADYWRDRLGAQRGGRLPESLTTAERLQIVRALAPDFDLIPSLRARTSEVNEELVRLTERQKELLEGLVDEPRVVVKGGAGTGKTLLACEEAIRLASEGKRTLFLCYGSRLANHLCKGLELHGVEVAHLHGFMADLIAEADLRRELPAVDARDLFDIYYPQVAMDALSKLGRFGSVDALVLDEGQDLLKPTYVQFFDALLRDEMSDGFWRLFYDPNQDIFMGGTPRELDRLEDAAVCYRLTKNCRNTREIALATAFVSGVKVAETLATIGPDVAEAWAGDSRGLQKGATRILRDWLSRGLDPAQVTILSPYDFERSLLGAIDTSKLPRQIVDVSKAAAQEGDGRFRFSTIAGFKGLESDAVLLVDIKELTDPNHLSLLYVAASRAKSVLGLVLPESCRATYSDRVADLVTALMNTGSSAC